MTYPLQSAARTANSPVTYSLHSAAQTASSPVTYSLHSAARTASSPVTYSLHSAARIASSPVTYVRATLDKQSCVITSTFVHHDLWSLVKADQTTFLKTKRLLVKPKCKQMQSDGGNFKHKTALSAEIALKLFINYY